MVTADGNWNWEAFSNVLPPYVILHIAAMSPPIPSFPNASIAWIGEASGKFSVRSAYKLSLGEISGEEDPSSRVLVERTLQAYGDVRGNVRTGHTIAATIKWSPPEEGWYKLNTDGATRKQDVHVLRRANSVADRLAKLAIPGSNCVTYLANPPPSIVPILQGDIASHLVSYDPLYVS
ncbi:hypothetical protein V6N13_129629 [Hibiscus sabdariffa]